MSPIGPSQAIRLLLQAAPSLQCDWSEYAAEPRFDPSLVTANLGWFARPFLALLTAGPEEATRRITSTVERLLLIGDEQVRPATVFGLLKAMTADEGLEAIGLEPLLRPETRGWWRGLNAFWNANITHVEWVPPQVRVASEGIWEADQARSAWDLVAPDLKPDGATLRDLYVFNTDLGDWQRLVGYLRRSEYPLEFRPAGKQQELPEHIRAIFENRNDTRPGLGVHVGPLLLNTHFFSKEEIEFDVDRQQIRGPDELTELIHFMVRIASVLSRDVHFAMESCPENPIFTYSPEMDRVVYHPPGA